MVRDSPIGFRRDPKIVAAEIAQPPLTDSSKMASLHLTHGLNKSAVTENGM